MDGDTDGPDLRSVGEITGDLIRRWEEDIVYISDRDRRKERELRRMDIYSFYFMIATESKRNKPKKKLDSDFGTRQP